MAAWRRNKAAISSNSDSIPPNPNPYLFLIQPITLSQSSASRPPAVTERDQALMATSRSGRLGCPSPWERLARRSCCEASWSGSGSESCARQARPNDATVTSLIKEQRNRNHLLKPRRVINHERVFPSNAVTILHVPVTDTMRCVEELTMA